MRIGYEKPSIEFEEYELNTAIAAGCDVTVDSTDTACGDYAQPLSIAETRDIGCYVTSASGSLSTS